MKCTIVILLVFMFMNLRAQEIIELPFQKIEGVSWIGEERAYYSQDWATEVVTNVSKPTMEVFRPSEPNGVALVVAPGGGLYAHSITSEGNDVAEWLVEKGLTVFVLKYRLVPTGEDGVKEFGLDDSSGKLDKRVAKVLPYAIEDAINAVKHVKQNAEAYGLDPNKVGLLGFSAGGAVTMGALYDSSEDARPAFVVPIYAWTRIIEVQEAPSDAPPMLIICATDDPLDLAPGSVKIYNSWMKAGHSVALHMYAQGGHGFGMRKLGFPSDDWIIRFYEWLEGQGFLD